MSSTFQATAAAPHSLLLEDSAARELRREASALPSWELTERQICDLELLLDGGFSPLDGFLRQEDYERVCSEMRLADGRLWPVPITLDVPEEVASALREGDRLALRHPEGMPLAVLEVDSSWRPDLAREARAVFGTDDDAHQGVRRLLRETHPVYLGGTLRGIELPPRHTFRDLRHSPRELRALFAAKGWSRVVAFQTRNPMHRAHMELATKAAAGCDAKLLLHPVIGPSGPEDVDAFTRVRCYRAVLPHLAGGSACLSLLPLAMRLAGPREAVWHALVRGNFGCTHFIIGRDHAGPGRDRSGRPFYAPDAAQELARSFRSELPVEIVPSEELVFVPELGLHVQRSEVPPGGTVLDLSGTELRKRLREGETIPSWFSREEVVTELRRAYPPRGRRGFAVFFTGLSGAGKSTIAQVLAELLREEGSRAVTVLDGDLVRKNLSSGLGFTRADRDLNIRRIAFVAAEVCRHGGAVICAPIAPFAEARREARQEIGKLGGFLEVHVATPLEVCEARDRKGLYARARAGLVPSFTGISDPYEVPEEPDLTLDARHASPEACAGAIVDRLRELGYLAPREPDAVSPS